MEAAFALLLPLVAGYLYVSTCNQLKYKQARDDGHRLYFRIAYNGLLLFLLAAALGWGLVALTASIEEFQRPSKGLVDVVAPLLKEPDKAPATIAFSLICAGSVVLGRALPYLDNLIFRERARRALLEAAEEDDLESLLLEAAVQFKSIAITTTTKKVYVGLVLQTPEPRTGRRMIALLPFMSGYRTDLGKVTFTTFYDQIYADRALERDDEESNDFRLILPVDKVVSVSFFDTETYAKFNAASPAPAPRRLKVGDMRSRRAPLN